MSVKIEWNGDKYIENIGIHTSKALIRCGNIVKASAKLNVPVDTGNLKGSIYQLLDKRNLKEIIYTNVEYSANVEMGTVHQNAQPYLRPALNDNLDNIRKIFIEEERKALDK